jgi:hypothetical protein
MCASETGDLGKSVVFIIVLMLDWIAGGRGLVKTIASLEGCGWSIT